MSKQSSLMEAAKRNKKKTAIIAVVVVLVLAALFMRFKGGSKGGSGGGPGGPGGMQDTQMDNVATVAAENPKSGTIERTSDFGFSAFITESSILSGTVAKAGIAGSSGFCTDSSFASVWKMEGALRHTWYPRSVQKCTTLSKPLSFETMMRLSSGFLTVYEPR